MAYYDGLFDSLGLRDWCNQSAEEAPTSMAALLGQLSGEGEDVTGNGLPFPSLDALHESCAQIPQTRDMTAGVENAFLAARETLKLVLDPITQPLSWMLDGALWLFTTTPWFIMVPLLVALTWFVARSVGVTIFVAASFLFLGFVDHLDVALETLSIIFVCTGLSVVIGVPIGIAMSRSNTLQRSVVPVLDLLQTLPTFVYLIPLIFLFSVTESKL